jgi:hypothetical protein
MWNGSASKAASHAGSRGLVRQHLQRDLVGLGQSRHPALDRVIERDLVLIDELHEQGAQVLEGDGAVAEVHRCGRWHIGHRLAERLGRHRMAVLSDLDDDGLEMVRLHLVLNDRCDG